MIFLRCYNCGEFANHIAAKCALGPQPKRCHHCKSTEHLIAECPSRRKSQNGSEEDEKVVRNHVKTLTIEDNSGAVPSNGVAQQVAETEIKPEVESEPHTSKNN